jgi:hypothetical protein
VGGAIPDVVGTEDSPFPEFLSQVSNNQHGGGLLPEDIVESFSRPIGLGIVRCSGLEVNALRSLLVLDDTVDVLLAIVTADGFDDWGSWVVCALILQVLADANESIWYMVLTLHTFNR